LWLRSDENKLARLSLSSGRLQFHFSIDDALPLQEKSFSAIRSEENGIQFQIIGNEIQVKGTDETMEPVMLQGHTSPVRALWLSPSREFLVSTSERESILWNLKARSL